MYYVTHLIAIYLTVFILNTWTWEYKLKRCSKKECCKQCRHVNFKGTMTKWPVHRKTHRTTQKHAEHTKTQQTFRRNFFLCFSDIFNHACIFIHVCLLQPCKKRRIMSQKDREYKVSVYK